MASYYLINTEITKTKKVVINVCFGGICLSDKAIELFKKYKAEEGIVYNVEDVKYLLRIYKFRRDDPALVRVVEELGSEANGECSELAIETVRDEKGWYYDIKEYDGREYIEEYRLSDDNKWRFFVEPVEKAE